MTAIEYNKEFCQLNHIPYDSKQNQEALRNYFKTLIRNNRAGGGNAYTDPDEIFRPYTPPYQPSVPAVTPSVTNDMVDLNNLLIHAEAQVALIKSLIAKQRV